MATASQKAFAKQRQFLSLVIISASVLPLCSCAPPAAIGLIGAGVGTKLLLDDLDDKATHVVQNAAASGSLLTSKMARDAQMLLDATKQSLDGELDKQWNQLDREKIDVLRAINTQLDTVQNITNGFGTLEDKAYLDTDSLVSRLPFAEKMPRIRKVEGSSQYYKTDGDYQVEITSNVFSPYDPDTHVSLNGKALQVIRTVDYSGRLAIPNNMLQFDDFNTKIVSLTVVTPNSKKKGKSFTFTIPLELFPRYVGYYQMDQTVDQEVPDPTSTPAKQDGPGMLIPGCGDSGCNAYWNVCTPMPLNATFISTVNDYDSFTGGWGGFATAGTPAPGDVGRICRTYLQHSHNVARLVHFDVMYHPGKTQPDRRAIIVKPVVAGKAEDPKCTTSSARNAPNVPSPTSGEIVGNGPQVCWLQFNEKYVADLAPTYKAYTLAVHMFNGQNYTLIDGNTEFPKPGITVDASSKADPRVAFRLNVPAW